MKGPGWMISKVPYFRKREKGAAGLRYHKAALQQ